VLFPWVSFFATVCLALSARSATTSHTARTCTSFISRKPFRWPRFITPTPMKPSVRRSLAGVLPGSSPSEELVNVAESGMAAPACRNCRREKGAAMSVSIVREFGGKRNPREARTQQPTARREVMRVLHFPLRRNVPPGTVLMPCLVLLSLLLAIPAAGADWPQFRGPSGDGHYDGPKLPTEWGPDNNVAWKTAIAGKGWSSPIVSKGKVYLTTAVPQAKGDQSLRAVCVNADTGKIEWDNQVFLAPKSDA